MTLPTSRLWIAIIAACVAATTWATAQMLRPDPSPVIFPPQSLPLRFSHALHVGEKGIGCDACHGAAKTSTSSLDLLIPTEAACRACHAIERDEPEKRVAPGEPPARCLACHPSYTPGGQVARVRIPPPNIKFSHKQHVEAGASCERCHGNMKSIGLATRSQLPLMQSCLDCHNQKRSMRQCGTCHRTDHGGRVRTRYPSGMLAPRGALRGDDHRRLDFRQNHATEARSDPKYCASCHEEQTFCGDCHNGIIKPMDFHVGDYIASHKLDALRDEKSCDSCHRRQTFCTGCHARSGVTADSRISEFGAAARFHPSGWTTRHAREAQRNIRSCASCHREETCLECHSKQPGSTAINPHPRGWAGSWRCRSLLKRAGRMCLRCHVDPREFSCN